jgi:hypothetical protein
MEPVNKSGKSIINGKLPAFYFSLLAGSAGMTIAFGIYGSISWELAMGQWGILNGVACYFIVRHNPSCSWYVWFTCNLMILVAGIIDPQFWVSDMWRGYLLIFILTIIGVITGVIFHKRPDPATESDPSQVKQETDVMTEKVTGYLQAFKKELLHMLGRTFHIV